MGEPVRVGVVLAALPGVAGPLAEARLLAAWPAVAGGAAAARTRPDSVEDGVLRVAVDSSGWLHRLTLEAPALLARCREVAPAVPLRGIRFHLAPLVPAAPGAGVDEREGFR
jgi:predicted nucleic acid-binding Zn ribbon protein